MLLSPVDEDGGTFAGIVGGGAEEEVGGAATPKTAATAMVGAGVDTDHPEDVADTPSPPTTPSSNSPNTPPLTCVRGQITPSSSGERSGGMASASGNAFQTVEKVESRNDAVDAAAAHPVCDKGLFESFPLRTSPAYALFFGSSLPVFRGSSSTGSKDSRRRRNHKPRARGSSHRNFTDEAPLPFDKFPLPARLLPLLAESDSFWSAVKSGQLDLALETLCMLTGLRRPMYRTESCGNGLYQIMLSMELFQKTYIASAGPASTPLSNLPRHAAAGVALDAMLVPVLGVAWRHDGEKQLSPYTKEKEAVASIDKPVTSFASFLSPVESRMREASSLEDLFAKMNVGGGRTKRAHRGALGTEGCSSGEDSEEVSGRREKREKSYRSPSPSFSVRRPRARLSFSQLAEKYRRPPTIDADSSSAAPADTPSSKQVSLAAPGTSSTNDEERVSASQSKPSSTPSAPMCSEASSLEAGASEGS